VRQLESEGSGGGVDHHHHHHHHQWKSCVLSCDIENLYVQQWQNFLRHEDIG
jgi:hypothetical protein